MAKTKVVATCLTGGKGRGGGKGKEVTLDSFDIYRTGRSFTRFMVYGSSKDCPHNVARILSKAQAESLAKEYGKTIKNWTPKKKASKKK